MKIATPDIKIKCKVSHLNTLIRYLAELLTNYDQYIKATTQENKNGKEICKYHLQTISEKVSKLIFNNTTYKDIKCTLKLNHAERLTLNTITSYYPLPLDINFIEYEIKNGLLK